MRNQIISTVTLCALLVVSHSSLSEASQAPARPQTAAPEVTNFCPKFPSGEIDVKGFIKEGTGEFGVGGFLTKATLILKGEEWTANGVFTFFNVNKGKAYIPELLGKGSIQKVSPVKSIIKCEYVIDPQDKRLGSKAGYQKFLVITRDTAATAIKK